MTIKKCEETLNILCELLLKFDRVINVCMVDFIVKDIFTSSLDEDLASNSLSLSQQEIADLPLTAYKQS